VHAVAKVAFSLLAGAGLLLAFRSVELHGQEPAPLQHPPAPRTVILLDAAHGGTDPGADLGNKVAEKDVTLALATRARAALAAQGFTVLMTRDAATPGVLTADQRAETANRSHALACLSFHATNSGSGVHIYTSALQPPPGASDTSVPIRWETAQEAFVPQSTQLASRLKTAIAGAGVPVDVRAATVPPIDSVMCPAVALEFGPLGPAGTAFKGADDPGYQDILVRALTAALAKWRTDTTPPPTTAPSPVKATQ
jgi:N-acetylmuramoyl-L-alanine amidase